jgi:hypothetical protein
MFCSVDRSGKKRALYVVANKLIEWEEWWTPGFKVRCGGLSHFLGPSKVYYDCLLPGLGLLLCGRVTSAFRIFVSAAPGCEIKVGGRVHPPAQEESSEIDYPLRLASTVAGSSPVKAMPVARE